MQISASPGSENLGIAILKVKTARSNFIFNAACFFADACKVAFSCTGCGGLLLGSCLR